MRGRGLLAIWVGVGAVGWLRGDGGEMVGVSAMEVTVLAYVAARFGASLRGVPLITRIAERANGRPLRPAEQDYTRALTEVWMGVLTALALVNVLMLVVPPGSFGWPDRVALDSVPVLLFLGEHFYRRWRCASAWSAPGLWVVVTAVMTERYPWAGKDRR